MLKLLVQSRKFWLTVCAVVVPILNAKLGWRLPTEQVVSVILAIIALVLAIAQEDSAEKKANSKPPRDRKSGRGE